MGEKRDLCFIFPGSIWSDKKGVIDLFEFFIPLRYDGLGNDYNWNLSPHF